jgi:polysaccharide export outer membrane protein
MEKIIRTILMITFLFAAAGSAQAQNPLKIRQGDDPLSSAFASVAKSGKKTEQNQPYLVGVEDILEISVIKPQEFSHLVSVAPDGAITFPYIGNVPVVGLSLSEIQEELQKRLADGYMEYPALSVSLKESRSRKFTIYGQVNKPGTYPVQEGLTMLRAITIAGGLISPGSTGEIKLLRPNDNGREAQVKQTQITAIINGEQEDMPVLAGDRIVVAMDKFFVSGQVARPGSYPVEENMTLLHAISVAGGFTDPNSAGTVKLIRHNNGGSVPEVIKTDIISVLNGVHQDIPVKSGDTIVVSVDQFYVHGEVSRPGKFPLEKNTTALTAISMAGGFIDSGSTGRIQLLRPNEGNGQLEVINSQVSNSVGGAKKDVSVRPGDTIVVTADKFYVSGQVARPGAYPVKDNMSILNAIATAGGLVEPDATGTVKLLRPHQDTAKQQKEDGRNAGDRFVVIESDIGSILKGDHQDAAVLAGDTIVVSSDKFYVYGEVARPGMYPLEKNSSVLTAISMAGGFTKFGSASRVKVLRASDEFVYDTIQVNLKDALAGHADSDKVLKAGDIVVVSEGMF